MFFKYFRPLPKCFKYQGNNYDLLLKAEAPNIEDILLLLELEGFSYIYSKEARVYFCELPVIH
mgnify:FL=1